MSDLKKIDEAKAAPVSSVLGVLLSVRELLTDESRWCQNAEKLGNSYCLVGAVARFAGGIEFSINGPLAGTINRLASLVGNIPTFNDAIGRKHSEILSVLDRAIAKELSAVRT